ncbi:hypothetical protein FGG08_004048 [Glutinoglossum americanum]|uniref:histidine kinase n=1 Tax=Glutinoglossum americanum TaxID=1670608 RepID=A0A9P8KXI1_9PEZI|nr:hypothetical protein FGG08_004048 [Glutinoglossum americanum]
MSLPDSLRRFGAKRQRPSSAETTHDNRSENLRYFPGGSASPAGNAQCGLSTAAAMAAGSHLVQFYDDPSHLHGVLSDFFAPFLVGAGGAPGGVVLARPRTIHQLGNRFLAHGYRQCEIYGSELLSQAGSIYRNGGKRVLMMDADKVLAMLVPGNELHVGVFDELLAGLMAQLYPPSTSPSSSSPSSPPADAQPLQTPPTYAYGELVDILCARGQHHLALELEACWNDFLNNNNVWLLCGYQMDSFRDSLVESVFNRICHSHSSIAPTESYSHLESSDEKLAMVATLQQKARAADEERRRPKYWSAGDTGESAEEQMRCREQFVETLCHELRNLVTGIVGNVEILQMGMGLRQSVLHRIDDNDGDITCTSPEDVSALAAQLSDDLDSLDAIAASADHMRAVSDNVLSLSKLESGKVILQSMPFDPKAAITDTIKMFTTPARNKGVELLRDLPSNDFRLIGDRYRFAQVIVNLVSNAIKFTDAGSITVQLRQLGPQQTPSPTAATSASSFEVAVRDTGRGLSEDERAVLFRRFAQPISTNYTSCGGSGLGLYISKYLVELMGGELRVESELGSGSTFVFTFQAEEFHGTQAPRCPTWGLPKDSATSPPVTPDTRFPPPQPLSRNDSTISVVESTSSGGSGGSSANPSSNSTRSSSATTVSRVSVTQSPHILIVDDNEVVQRTIVRLLTLSSPVPSMITSTASNGFECISKLISASSTASPISLILMDLHMPYLDGVATTAQIRALPVGAGEGIGGSRGGMRDVPIIGLSGDGKEETAEMAKSAGMDECLEKPVRVDALLEVIGEVSERRQRAEPHLLSRRGDQGDRWGFGR